MENEFVSVPQYLYTAEFLILGKMRKLKTSEIKVLDGLMKGCYEQRIEGSKYGIEFQKKRKTEKG